MVESGVLYDSFEALNNVNVLTKFIFQVILFDTETRILHDFQREQWTFRHTEKVKSGIATNEIQFAKFLQKCLLLIYFNAFL